MGCKYWSTQWITRNKLQRNLNPSMYKDFLSTWWRHQMETFSALLAICAGNSPHKGQWRGALMFSGMCARINRWVNNREAGDLRRYRHHYDVIVMKKKSFENAVYKKSAYLEASILFPMIHLGLYSLSGKTSYGKISGSLEAARFGFRLFQSLWNLTGTSAAVLPRCLLNFRALRLS